MQRTYEYQVHKITLLQEDIWDKTNAINDLGNHFETLTNEVEIIASYANIIAEIKEVTDRLLLFIAIEPAEGELPKELTEIRLKLKQIEAY